MKRFVGTVCTIALVLSTTAAIHLNSNPKDKKTHCSVSEVHKKMPLLMQMKMQNQTQDEIIGNLSAKLGNLSEKLNASEGNDTLANERQLNSTLSIVMTPEQMKQELATNYFNKSFIHQPMNNTKIHNTLNFVELMTTKHVNETGSVLEKFEMGPKDSHDNFVLVYAPSCEACWNVKGHFERLSRAVKRTDAPVNLIAINDGIDGYQKVLPNATVSGYPFLALYKGKGGHPVLFEAKSEPGKETPYYEMTYKGFNEFLTKNGVKGLPKLEEGATLEPEIESKKLKTEKLDTETEKIKLSD